MEKVDPGSGESEGETEEETEEESEIEKEEEKAEEKEVDSEVELVKEYKLIYWKILKLINTTMTKMKDRIKLNH